VGVALVSEQRSIEIPDVITDDVLYHYRLGVFHSMWSTLDVIVDMAVGEFLGLKDQDALAVTWGMMFGAKAKLLRQLVKRSDHPNKAAISKAIGDVWGGAKRDVVTHGYAFEGPTRVVFLEKPRGSDFQPVMHEFSHEEFGAHVDRLIRDGNALYRALGYDGARVEAFALEALSRAKPPGKHTARAGKKRS
jgi:hypothetical protein